jgi:carboxyl-terminal processing protease
MNKFNYKSVNYILLLVCMFLVGYFSQRSMDKPVFALSFNSTEGLSVIDKSVSLVSIQVIQDAMRQVTRQYVEPISEAKTREMAYSAIKGMLLPLNDPYTRFMDPTDLKEFREDTDGHFAGIGATLSMEEVPAIKDEGHGTRAPILCPVCGTIISDVKTYRVVIVEPLPNTPAKKAGLMPGDIILKVNDKLTDGMMVDEVTEMIRGKEGEKVTLLLARKGEGKTVSVTITRAVIEVPAVEYRMIEGNIGYLRLIQFNSKTGDETEAALIDLKAKGAKGLLLDLRNNPGGLLDVCIRISTMFLPQDNKLIVSTKSRGGYKDEYNRLDESQIWTLPITVLVNKGSASASEILSGALKDYKRAKLVGEPTFGKALVQTVIPLGTPEYPCAMPVTTAHYYTPSGYDLAKKGISPDIAVALDKDTKHIDEKDNQAQVALKDLKEKMK